MNELLGFAKKMLVEYDGFHPFGGYLNSGGEVVHVGVQTATKFGDASGKANALAKGFKELADQSGSIGFGIATDVKLPCDDGSKRDAIKFFLEHRDGYCAEVFFRYELTAEDLVITDVSAQQGTPQFFAPTNLPAE